MLGHWFMFEDSVLISQAKTLITSLPPEKKIAVVAVVNNKNASVIFALRVNNEWSIQSYGELDKDHGLNYGATVMFSK